MSRTVFAPVPNVDSVLVGLRRVAPAPPPALRALVGAAFAHRRKALARSLALAPQAPPAIRERARAALDALGHPPDARAERLSPQDFRALHETLRAMTELRSPARAKINLCLFVGPDARPTAATSSSRSWTRSTSATT